MKIHIIGVSGKLNAGLAVELQNQGHVVTGSDKGFYPPMSTFLEKHNFKMLIGYKAEHIDENDKPDLVAYSSLYTAENNPEVARALELDIETTSPTQLLQDFVVRENSIVVTGTYGKTTITGLLVHIFDELGLKPNYMVGGDVCGLDNAVRIDENTKWSILEGDEYPADGTGKSKFFFYNPKYLVITSCEWDHTDIFKSEEIYVNNFMDLVDIVEKENIVANNNGKNIYKLDIGENYIYDDKLIERLGDNKYRYHVFVTDLDISEIKFSKSYIFTPTIFGRANLENIAACLKLCELVARDMHDIDFDEFFGKVFRAIETFGGVARRLELKFENDTNVVIDDFAHNPSKFAAAIEAVEEKYPDHDIIALLIPNTGNRTKLSLSSYQDIFDSKQVHEIIIPRWKVSNLKEDSELASEDDLAAVIGEKAQVVKSDDDLFKLLQDRSRESQKKVFLFMGVEPFRGLIDQLVSYLEK